MRKDIEDLTQQREELTQQRDLAQSRLEHLIRVTGMDQSSLPWVCFIFHSLKEKLKLLSHIITYNYVGGV